nr:glycoside hydrolase family 38 C-terminal domain-containing protein [Paludisphaera mucosa]
MRVAGCEPRPVDLAFGRRVESFPIPAADSARTIQVAIEAGGEAVASRTVDLPPVRPLTIYVLPHSHTDVGYTGIQSDIEEKQVNNLLQGMAEARRTADFPEGARFVWNVEGTWVAKIFLERLGEAERAAFVKGVQDGSVGLNGMLLNTLTGLCRPAELLRLFREAARLGELTGKPVDAAMISDVPGYTWGTVSAMNQAGIRYFSVAPNFFDRIGGILANWENKPFWWVGPDGTSRVLVWIPRKGYALSHLYHEPSERFAREFCEDLERRGYPYDIAYIRWSGLGDNATPDGSICDFVKDWNATHASPRFVIASTSLAFRAFEAKYGDKLPEVRGDWTAYWEDGAGSTAVEMALNRAASDRLAQAEALWAMLQPRRFPAAEFDRAWDDVLLFSEHTWGAHCSVTQPAIPFTTDQWAIKQSFATAANLQSRRLLGRAAMGANGFEPDPAVRGDDVAARVSRIDVYNTSSWPRTEVVSIPREVAPAGDFATDDAGKAVPAQRLANDELALLVSDLPPFSGRRYTIRARAADASPSSTPPAPATAAGAVLANDKLRVLIDETTGAIAELRAEGIDANLVDSSGGHALNDYLYFTGDDPAAARRNDPVTIGVRNNGPLVASLTIESTAPGCHRLSREIRLAAGSGHVEMINTVDKKRLEAASYMSKEGKESLNFAFPFHVPGGEIRIDAPLTVFRPEVDQLAGSCKNWLTVGRWVDVANADFGATWATLDAPLVQLGGLTANLLNSQGDPAVWRQKIGPTQEVDSWAMNNHWGTNYKAYQEGPAVFRYVVRPHKGRVADAEASRFAVALTQPLVVVPGRGRAPASAPLLQVDPPDVLVAELKPSDDGRAIVVRLMGAEEPRGVRLTWGLTPTQVRLSGTGEQPNQEVGDAITVPARSIITLRAEFAD